MRSMSEMVILKMIELVSHEPLMITASGARFMDAYGNANVCVLYVDTVSPHPPRGTKHINICQLLFIHMKPAGIDTDRNKLRQFHF